MLWKNERSKYGITLKEKVQIYECTFGTVGVHNGTTYNTVVRCLVVCDTVEGAIAACRQQWPTDFVLHQIVKRNQRCDLIITDAAMGLCQPHIPDELSE